MQDVLTAFILGLFGGALIGMCVMALMTVAKQSDERMEQQQVGGLEQMLDAPVGGRIDKRV